MKAKGTQNSWQIESQLAGVHTGARMGARSLGIIMGGLPLALQVVYSAIDSRPT